MDELTFSNPSSNFTTSKDKRQKESNGSGSNLFPSKIKNHHSAISASPHPHSDCLPVKMTAGRSD